ncbi:DUF5063 domain-containing protein [Novosphingobium sp. SG720]|uniref:DUF5063 domain-containing protein n=1 Tax=Novosphingobium sp. SG720 TaxID=2586998 RepID=UPI001444A289|nr:DUF5063 domain-containing protein [Novosphingobium sp. SG720]NKJ42690.1 hypothetical protein [Novosphingobium sp. SG720]
MISAINAYLALLNEKPEKEASRLAKLCEVLDALPVEYHRAPNVEPDTLDVSASVPYEPFAIRALASFPELGHYAVVDPLEGVDQEVILGDAIDDLADIARDLSGVLLLIEKGAINDAIWDFRFGYETHWGVHLHQLRSYLHSIMRRFG